MFLLLNQVKQLKKITSNVSELFPYLYIMKENEIILSGTTTKITPSLVLQPLYNQITLMINLLHYLHAFLLTLLYYSNKKGLNITCHITGTKYLFKHNAMHCLVESNPV